MTMYGAIALFVKTPGISPVKTRLAKELGVEAAESFHLAAARAVAAVINASAKQAALQGVYAVAEQSALADDLWQDLPCLWQGEGGLGERMSLVYETLLKQYDFVILVGADIPQMTVTHLLKATDWLARDEHARFAFGPSVDGGFWLFGGNCSLPHNLWADVTYSVADTGQQFLNKIDSLGEVQTITLLQDVDELQDLIHLHESLRLLSDPMPEQLELIRFLESLPLNFFKGFGYV